MSNNTVSVIILCKEANDRFVECVNSAKSLANEIIVYSSNSDDILLNKLSEQHSFKVFYDTKWDGFGIQRQKAQQYVTSNYCLWLDSDEVLTDKLVAEIKRFLSTAKENDILAIPRLNHVLGLKVKHCGWYPDYVLRLHSNKYTTYNDFFVHEKLILKDDSKVTHAKNYLLHYTYDSLENMYHKQQTYCSLWAKNTYLKKHKFCSLITPFYKAAFMFVKKYLLQLGFLDGKIGLIVSATSAQYTFTKYMILYSYKYQNNDKI